MLAEFKVILDFDNDDDLFKECKNLEKLQNTLKDILFRDINSIHKYHIGTFYDCCGVYFIKFT